MDQYKNSISESSQGNSGLIFFVKAKGESSESTGKVNHAKKIVKMIHCRTQQLDENLSKGNVSGDVLGIDFNGTVKSNKILDITEADKFPKNKGNYRKNVSYRYPSDNSSSKNIKKGHMLLL